MDINAHLDTRPLNSDNQTHSGSPFYQLLTDPRVHDHGCHFHEFAVQGNQCLFCSIMARSSGYLKYWRLGLGKCFQQVIDNLSNTENTTFISFEIDSIASAICLCVSCPAVVGLTTQRCLDICLSAGEYMNICILNICEFNLDLEEDRTTRLVATMVFKSNL